MSLRLMLATCAVAALATPTLAAAQTPPAPAPVSSPARAALQEKAMAFQSRMQAMESEMRGAVTAAAGDEVKANADLDAIVARYQPEADAFAQEVAAFINAQAAMVPEAQRGAMAEAAVTATAELRAMPTKMRMQTLQPPVPVAVAE